MIAANFPSPPTKAAHQACVAFITALPYLVPCRHCGWDLGDFIKRNIDNDGQTDPGCFGFDGQGFSQSVCESPERACMSTYRMTSFFARAHNNVNSHTNPCRKPYTTEEALDQYLYAPDGTCHHNTVWGSDPVPDLANQLCTGPYCDKTPITGSCYQPGSLLPVGGDGTGCIGDCPDLGTPEAGHADYRYYGTNATAGCDTNTAVACGNVQCHAPSTVKSTFSGKDEQGKHDFFTLRKFFDEKEISFEFSRPHFVGVALEMLKDKSSSELEQLEHKDPAVFEVMERRGSPRARTTGTSSGASSLRSSGSTSGSSGGSGACGSGSS